MASSVKDAGDGGETLWTQDQYDMSGVRHAFLLCVKEGRRGAEQDVEKVENLLQEFNFVLSEPCIDPKSEEIVREVEMFRDKVNESPDVSCVFIFLMAHGDKGKILGTDRGEGVELKQIFTLFDNKNCPGLQLKPKVFVIQACRGKLKDHGVKSNLGFRSLNQDEEEETVEATLPTMTDTFTVYPAQLGHVAYRYPEKGSTMITLMGEVFQGFGSSLHLYDLFVKVNQKMIKEEFTPQGQKAKTTLVMESTLTKAVYLTK